MYLAISLENCIFEIKMFQKYNLVCNVFFICKKNSLYVKHSFQNMIWDIPYVRLCSICPVLVRLLKTHVAIFCTFFLGRRIGNAVTSFSGMSPERLLFAFLCVNQASSPRPCIFF